MKKNTVDNIKVAILLISLFAIIVGYPVAYTTSSEMVTFTVDEKFIKRHNESDRYLVSTTDGDVLENTDSVIFFKWNSSNIYAKLKKRHRYHAKVAGWRWPILSMKRNIISVQDLGLAAKAVKSTSEIDRR